MRQRILTGWTFTRLLYIGLGTSVIINSVTNHKWLGILFGGYFASMEIFTFGCATGNCFGGSCDTEVIPRTKTEVQDIEFEEVKLK